MAYDYYYYVLIKKDKALLIERIDYEESTVFASGNNDYTEHKLLETMSLEKYEKEGKNLPLWNQATLVDENTQFIDSFKGEWDEYEYRTNGCGVTRKDIKKQF